MNDREILIGKTRVSLSTAQPRWVADWYLVNDPEKSASVPETLDGTRHIENIDEWLRPKVKLMFNFNSDVDYAEAEKIFVLGQFVLNIYQPVINRRFTGCFLLSQRQLELFLMMRNKYKGVVNYQIEAESKYTYDTWEHLESLAESDPRFN